MARGCANTGVCAAAVLEAKQFAGQSWALVDPRGGGGGMPGNRRQGVASYPRAGRNTVAARGAGGLAVGGPSGALYGGHPRPRGPLVLQPGGRHQRGHQGHMRGTGGKWQGGSAR